MKLYTEEQLKKAFHRGEINEGCTALQIHVDDFIDSLAPIELPNDEEIEAFAMGYYNGEGHEYYVNIGIKFIIDKIKNQQQ